MAREDLTEIVVIMDESGSMQPLVDDSIGGFNSFIQKQRDLEGDAKVTLVCFSNETEVHYLSRPIKEVHDLTTDVYNPTGGTALFDAIGKGISELKERRSSEGEEEMADKVIFLIITDGQENSSYQYDAALLKKMIIECKRDRWEFIFIGASEEILDQAESLGIDKDRRMKYRGDSYGTKSAYCDFMDAAVTSYRGTGKVEMKHETDKDS